MWKITDDENKKKVRVINTRPDISINENDYLLLFCVAEGPGGWISLGGLK